MNLFERDLGNFAWWYLHGTLCIAEAKKRRKGGGWAPVLHLEGHVGCTENSEYCSCFCKVHAGELYRITHQVWPQFSEHCPSAVENLLLRRVTKLTSLEVFHSSPPPPPLFFLPLSFHYFILDVKFSMLSICLNTDIQSGLTAVFITAVFVFSICFWSNIADVVTGTVLLFMSCTV